MKPLKLSYLCTRVSQKKKCMYTTKHRLSHWTPKVQEKTSYHRIDPIVSTHTEVALEAA